MSRQMPTRGLPSPILPGLRSLCRKKICYPSQWGRDGFELNVGRNGKSKFLTMPYVLVAALGTAVFGPRKNTHKHDTSTTGISQASRHWMWILHGNVTERGDVGGMSQKSEERRAKRDDG
ncbi:predicted protein [Histoplasma capsulatum var. duboisii H88]|uniref:Predicted protein n=1 Tax=Ajellomyces capsulatus (strain H88) TaxID=544711 RepID=F0UDP4_AJEC8|nr:predicted protein [Histoplasma capsulatum var. duboisii H88]